MPLRTPARCIVCVGHRLILSVALSLVRIRVRRFAKLRQLRRHGFVAKIYSHNHFECTIQLSSSHLLFRVVHQKRLSA